MTKITGVYNSLISMVQALIKLSTLVVDLATVAHDKLQKVLEALKHQTGA